MHASDERKTTPWWTRLAVGCVVLLFLNALCSEWRRAPATAFDATRTGERIKDAGTPASNGTDRRKDVWRPLSSPTTCLIPLFSDAAARASMIGGRLSGTCLAPTYGQWTAHHTEELRDVASSNPNSAEFRPPSSRRARLFLALTRHGRIVFAGDSIMRELFHAVRDVLRGEATVWDHSEHGDMRYAAGGRGDFYAPASGGMQERQYAFTHNVPEYIPALPRPNKTLTGPLHFSARFAFDRWMNDPRAARSARADAATVVVAGAFHWWNYSKPHAVDTALAALEEWVDGTDTDAPTKGGSPDPTTAADAEATSVGVLPRRTVVWIGCPRRFDEPITGPRNTAIRNRNTLARKWAARRPAAGSSSATTARRRPLGRRIYLDYFTIVSWSLFFPLWEQHWNESAPQRNLTGVHRGHGKWDAAHFACVAHISCVNVTRLADGRPAVLRDSWCLMHELGVLPTDGRDDIGDAEALAPHFCCRNAAIALVPRYDATCRGSPQRIALDKLADVLLDV